MAVGVDLYFAEIVLNLMNNENWQITLECALPCPNRTLKWFKTDILRYNEILNGADSTSLISNFYTPYCMLKRNRYMVDKSDVVLAVFNGIEKGETWYTIDYAQNSNKQIELLLL